MASLYHSGSPLPACGRAKLSAADSRPAGASSGGVMDIQPIKASAGNQTNTPPSALPKSPQLRLARPPLTPSLSPLAGRGRAGMTITRNLSHPLAQLQPGTLSPQAGRGTG